MILNNYKLLIKSNSQQTIKLKTFFLKLSKKKLLEI